jgi:hypothetical protein
VAAEGEDRRPVPLKRDLEGSLIAGSDLLDEAIVAREPE